MNKLLLIMVVVAFYSCNNTNNNNQITTTDTLNNSESIIEDTINTTLNEQDEFVSFFNQFTTEIIAFGGRALKEHIHPQNGLVFIFSNGAMPQFYIGESFKDFRNAHPEVVLNHFDKNTLNPTVIIEELPKVVCTDNIYDKQGCYGKKVNLLSEIKIWNYAELSKEEKKEIEVRAQLIDYTVINTNNFVFYFSKINDIWYITFIDIRVPCSA